MNKKMILVAAPPACGKTYVSELIAESCGHIVYLDKDDLGDLIKESFKIFGQKVDMDGDFYTDNLRPVEYSTMLNIGLSALRFENIVLLNAPFGKEVRDAEYMKSIKERANENNAELLLVWVSASPQICYERMKNRNLDRDVGKLKNWDEYVKKINFTPPYELKDRCVVDKFVIFDTSNEQTVQLSLNKTLKLLQEG